MGLGFPASIASLEDKLLSLPLKIVSPLDAEDIYRVTFGGNLRVYYYALQFLQLRSTKCLVDMEIPFKCDSITYMYAAHQEDLLLLKVVIVQVTLGRVLQALLTLKGMMIEWVQVKSYDETPELWTESRHKVFRKVTENTHAAMLHFYSPTMPEFGVRSFMTWLHSYNNLFSEPCKRCGNYLQSSLPPTCRDVRTLEPFHEECKP